MPVENPVAGRQPSLRTVPRQAAPELKKAFVDALSTGMASGQIVEELGIGLSTYYKWKSRWEEQGDAWLEGKIPTKGMRRQGSSVKNLHDTIVKISLEHPAWGAARIAKVLSERIDTSLSTGTVHNVLTARGLSTKQSRTVALYEKFCAKEKLSGEQLEALEELNPFAAWSRGQSLNPGERLVQQEVSIPHTSLLGKCRIMIIVDACDQRAFAKFGNSEFKFLDEVVTWYQARGIKVAEVMTNNGYQYFGHYCSGAYQSYLSKAGIRHRFDTSSTSGLRLNPLVKDVWGELRRYLFTEIREDCINARGKPSTLNSQIQGFLDRTFGGS